MSVFAYAWRIAVLSLGLAVLVPTRVSSLDSRPHPSRDHAAAMQLVAAFRRGDSTAAVGGESIILEHGTRTPRAVVLLHGLTNSPRQFRALAAALYDLGDNVFVPRLPHHAIRGADAGTLAEMTAEELRGVADTSIDIATGLGDTVIVLGLSLGGDVGAWIAQFRADVRRAVIIAPALGISRVPARLEKPMMNFGLRFPNYSHREAPDTLRPDRTLGWSSHGVAEMMRLGEATLRAASHRAPATRDIRLVVNRNDHTVSRAMIDDLADQWIAAGGHVERTEFPDSLGLPHDVVDPDQPKGNVGVVYPVLIALVHDGPFVGSAVRPPES